MKKIKLLGVSALLLLTLAPFSSLSFADEQISEPLVGLPQTEKNITIDLKDADLLTTLRSFAKETGQNIVVSKDVYGTITLSIKNLPAREAFRRIIQAGNLKYTYDGKSIYVFPSMDGPSIVAMPGGTYAKVFEINYSDPDAIKETLTSLVPPGTNILTTKGSKRMVVESNLQVIKRVDALIKSIDIPPRQVLVEAKIIEVTYSNNANLGANLSYTNPNNPSEQLQTVNLANQPTNTSAQGMYYSVTNNNIQAVAEAFQSRTGYNLLSSPRVLAMNGQEAQIITGSRLGYKTKTVTATGMIETVEFLDVGTQLKITPQIKSDGSMIMDIHPEVSDGSIVNDLPQKNSTETTTRLIIKDGQTIVIGGLIKDYSNETKKGVPILADIPIIGIPFRNTTISTQKREIIILISPHIVDAAQIAQMQDAGEALENQRRNNMGTVPASLLK